MKEFLTFVFMIIGGTITCISIAELLIFLFMVLVKCFGPIVPFALMGLISIAFLRWLKD